MFVDHTPITHPYYIWDRKNNVVSRHQHCKSKNIVLTHALMRS